MLVRALLFLAVALPALAVSMGRQGDRVVFVLYREPKLVAATCLSWILLAAVAWTRPELLRPARLAATVRRPAVWLFLATCGWLAATGMWVQVHHNWVYEMTQYVTFGALFVVLVTWARTEAGILRTVQWALATSLGVVTLIGLAQWAGLSLPALSSLAPIRPDIGAPHPSLMGYKNPAALAVVGQIFVLTALAWRARSGRLRAAFATLLALEILYVVSLGSRTAVLALAAGLAALLVLGLVALRGAEPGAGTSRLIRASVGLVVLFAVALGVASAANPALRERLGTMVGFAVSPTAYLESDRGVYLRNTVHMARHEPLGVGLGDWQTAYPVYRASGRSVSFDGSFEVRRAHSDHVQMLGEGGWMGLALWLGWLGALIWVPARDFLRSRDPARGFLAAQVVTLAAAMATDYVIELPYGKLQFFLVAALAVSRPAEGEGDEADKKPRSVRGRLVALGIGALAAVACLAAVGHLQKVQVAAEMQRRYELALADLQTSGRVERARLESILALGERFQVLPGGDKTSYRTQMVMGHSALLLGRRDVALAAASQAIRLQPHSADALGLMARIVPEPCASSWRRARTYVLDQATAGFSDTYPSCGLPPS